MVSLFFCFCFCFFPVLIRVPGLFVCSPQLVSQETQAERRGDGDYVYG